MTLGFTLLHFELVGYGVSFFAFLPFILGYLLGKKTVKNLSLVGFGISFFTFCILLLEGELEGMVCILLSFPLILFFFIIGSILKAIFYLFVGETEYEGQDNNILDNDILKSSILPFCIFIVFGVVEKQLTKSNHEVISVSSEIILPYTPLQVYETIKSVDTLDAEKPFLMQLDLPVPQKCILEEERVGGLRTCYFEGGKIVERVTALEKAKLLKMDVIDYELTGRTWLAFEEAIYTFEELPNGSCKMVRITTYTSELYPRVYWEPLEKIGIEQEHTYVFSNLEKDLKRTYTTVF